MSDERVELVERPDALQRVLETVSGCEAVAIDIESNGFYRYFDRTCILTVSIPGRDWVVDSLALWDDMPGFGEVFAAPDSRILLHSGSYDVTSLKRDFDLTFEGIFDTSIAAQLLGYEALGLATLVHKFFGTELPKKLQRHNWAERPLKPAHIRYLAGDTRHLFELGAILEEKIIAHDLVEEMRIDCEALAALPPSSTTPVDPENFRRIKDSRDMSPRQRGVLRALFVLRDTISRELDLAPFRVMGNGVLVGLALAARPDGDMDLAKVRGMSQRVRDNYGDKIREAVRRGWQEPQPEHRPKGGGDNQAKSGDAGNGRLTPEQRELEKRIKTWRAREAGKRGVGIQAVLPTPALQQIVRQLPRSNDDLSTISRLGSRRVERYASALLSLVASIPDPP